MYNLVQRPTFRKLAARICLILGMVGPGLFLLVRPDGWVTTTILASVLGFSSFFIAIIGGILLLAGLIAIFFERVLDFCYIYAAIFFALIFVGSVIALFQGVTITALVLAEPVLVWAYMEASVTITKRRERLKNPWDESEES